jgi:hypothetical protein
MRFAATLIAAAFLTSPALADERSDAAAEILSCGSVKGDKARLKCFEKAAPALREAFPEAAAIAEARAEEARLAAKEEAKEDFGLPAAVANADEPFEEKEFGAENLPKSARADDEDDGDVDSIEANVTEIGHSLNGKIIVFLDNGQIWRQIDADTSSPYIRKNIEGMTATVKRGVLSSYVVRLSGTRDAFKARRVK